MRSSTCRGRIVASDTLPQSTGAGAARVASDGHTYLLAWIDGADVASVRVALLDESGRHSPTYTLSSEARVDVAPVVTWDGTRYLVFWSATDDGGQSARFTEVTAQGVSFGVKTLANVPYVASAISSNGSTTIVWSTIEILNVSPGVRLITGQPRHVGQRSRLGPHDRDEALLGGGAGQFGSRSVPCVDRQPALRFLGIPADGRPYRSHGNSGYSGRRATRFLRSEEHDDQRQSDLLRVLAGRERAAPLFRFRFALHPRVAARQPRAHGSRRARRRDLDAVTALSK